MAMAMGSFLRTSPMTRLSPRMIGRRPTVASRLTKRTIGERNEAEPALDPFRRHCQNSYSRLVSPTPSRAKFEERSEERPRPGDGDASGGPSPEQLRAVRDKLADSLPQIFYDALDYDVYRSDLIFVNNIKGGKTTIGLYHYIKQVALLRTVGHLKYAHVKFHILKITQKPDDSSVIVRWKITGVSGLKVLFTFWRFKLWKMRQVYDDQETWLEGLSFFYVGSDGKIYKHVADKMLPDEENAAADPISKAVAGKLALMSGLASENRVLFFDGRDETKTDARSTSLKESTR